MQPNADTTQEPIPGAQYTANAYSDVDNYIMPTYMDAGANHYGENHSYNTPDHASQDQSLPPAELTHTQQDIPVDPTSYDNRSTLSRPSHRQHIPRDSTYDESHASNWFAPVQAIRETLPLTRTSTLHGQPPTIAHGEVSQPHVSAEAYSLHSHVGQAIAPTCPVFNSKRHRQQYDTAQTHSNDLRPGPHSHFRHGAFVDPHACRPALGASAPAHSPDTRARQYVISYPADAPYCFGSYVQGRPVIPVQIQDAAVFAPGRGSQPEESQGLQGPLPPTDAAGVHQRSSLHPTGLGSAWNGGNVNATMHAPYNNSAAEAAWSYPTSTHENDMESVLPHAMVGVSSTCSAVGTYPLNSSMGQMGHSYYHSAPGSCTRHQSVGTRPMDISQHTRWLPTAVPIVQHPDPDPYDTSTLLSNNTKEMILEIPQTSLESRVQCVPNPESFDARTQLLNNPNINLSAPESPGCVADIGQQFPEDSQQRSAYPSVVASLAVPESVFQSPFPLASSIRIPSQAQLDHASPTETYFSRYNEWSPSRPWTNLPSAATTPGPAHGGQAGANNPDATLAQDDANPWPAPGENLEPTLHTENTPALFNVACRIGACNRLVAPTVKDIKVHLKEFHKDYYGERGRDPLRCRWMRPSGRMCRFTVKRPNLGGHIEDRHF